MKIVISGYGKMGKEIETAALAHGHEIIACIDKPGDWEIHEKVIRQADAVIDFSMPACVVSNIRRSFDFHLPLIVGTTGWNEQEGPVRQWCENEGQSVFVASNFSVGVNILFALTKKLAGLLNHLPEYDISLEEIHHIHKLDSPSGTAIRLAEIILGGIKSKDRWVNRPRESSEELEIISRRVGEITGTHIIRCTSEHDILVLTHEAKNRKGFATGALMAAEWIQGKKGWFGMADMLQI